MMSTSQPRSRRHLFARRVPCVIALALQSRAVVAQPAAHASQLGRVESVSSGGRASTDEIRFAVLPLPEQLRDAATVMRMDSTHRPVVVRQGSNGMVCMRVVPGEAAWDARCYEATIARLIFRAGELVMSGTRVDSLGPRIQAEVRAGSLALPPQPAAAYRALGPRDAYDPETGVATARMEIWQSLHVPFATAEAMGLPDESTLSDAQRARTAYVVSSGTWWSHVVIGHSTPGAVPRNRP